MWNPFHKVDQGVLIKEAHDRIALLSSQKMILDVEKDNLMLRQVELWSIFNLNEGLEDEYKKVSERISRVIVLINSFKQRITHLTMGTLMCENKKQCVKLQEYLAQEAQFILKPDDLPAKAPKPVHINSEEKDAFIPPVGGSGLHI